MTKKYTVLGILKQHMKLIMKLKYIFNNYKSLVIAFIFLYM